MRAAPEVTLLSHKDVEAFVQKLQAMLGVSFNSQALGLRPQAVSASEEVRHIARDIGKVNLLVINLPDQGQAFVTGVSQHGQRQQFLRREVQATAVQSMPRSRPPV